MILPDYLREAFVQAALSYIACNGEGDFGCRDNDCWCNCNPNFPECNCPYMDIRAMEESLERITDTWEVLYREFEESGGCSVHSLVLQPAAGPLGGAVRESWAISTYIPISV